LGDMDGFFSEDPSIHVHAFISISPY
jgi:hypothetical protein